MREDRKLYSRFSARGFLILWASLLVMVSGGSAAAAPTETVLYSFTGSNDGSLPEGGLVFDSAGNLYGTTELGGVVGTAGVSNAGTVFKLSPPVAPATAWTETLLYSFCSTSNCSDGYRPTAGLIFDGAGNLYGTTTGGGIFSAAAGGGVVFKIAPDKTETVLYAFCSQPSCADGADPYAGLMFDKAGNLYGTTANGGAFNKGTVFKLSPPVPPATAWTETVLYSFTGALLLSTGTKDGANPYAGVIADSRGNLYGTTSFGAGGGKNGDPNGNGVVFKLRTDGTEGAFYPFHVYDGWHPTAGLNFDSAGNLYGTTPGGGAHRGGVVFMVSPARAETVLYSFCSRPNCSDGAGPQAGMIFDSTGNLYGTAQGDGVGSGVVFKLSPPISPATTWSETVPYTFCSLSNCIDGSGPNAAVIFDSAGNLYGTTSAGGASGKGTVFKLSP